MDVIFLNWDNSWLIMDENFMIMFDCREIF